MTWVAAETSMRHQFSYVVIIITITVDFTQPQWLDSVSQVTTNVHEGKACGTENARLNNALNF